MTTAEGFAHIDQLLAILGRQNRGTLTLEAGQPARIVGAGGTSRDVSGRVLSRQEILAMVGPIVPEDARRQLPKEPSVSFDYAAPALGPFKLTMARDSERLIVTIVSGQAAPEPSTAPPVVAAEPAAPQRVQADVPAAPPVATVAAGPPIDRLFRLMAAAGASDLHLCVGMPPLIRKDGAHPAARTRGAALDPAAIAALLEPIMPEQERDRIRRPPRHRLRLRDRRAGAVPRQHLHGSQGPGAVFRVIPTQDPDRRAARPLAAHPAPLPV